MPMQMIEISGGVLLKRGCTEIKIGGKGVGPVIKILLTATSKEGATAEELLSLFIPEHRETVKHLIGQLVRRKLLVSYLDTGLADGTPESALDVFYWHFDARSTEVNERLNSRHIGIIGVNSISRQLAMSFLLSGINNFRVVDHPFLRSLHFFDESGRLQTKSWPNALSQPAPYNEVFQPYDYDCLVATSDFGRTPVLLEWNKLCIESNRHFLPVVLHNMVGDVGPLVIPGASPCYQCSLLRQASHSDVSDLRNAVEHAAFEGQPFIGFHPSMASILADIAAVELMKFYSGVIQGRVGSLIEVNLLSTKMTSRKVMKVPRCPTCSPLNIRPPTTPKKSLFATSEEVVQ